MYVARGSGVCFLAQGKFEFLGQIKISQVIYIGHSRMILTFKQGLFYSNLHCTWTFLGLKLEILRWNLPPTGQDPVYIHSCYTEKTNLRLMQRKHITKRRTKIMPKNSAITAPMAAMAGSVCSFGVGSPDVTNTMGSLI